MQDRLFGVSIADVGIMLHFDDCEHHFFALIFQKYLWWVRRSIPEDNSELPENRNHYGRGVLTVGRSSEKLLMPKLLVKKSRWSVDIGPIFIQNTKDIFLYLFSSKIFDMLVINSFNCIMIVQYIEYNWSWEYEYHI